MNRVFIFPGQGSQLVGMGKEFYKNFPVAKLVFEEVDEALKQNLSKIIFEGPEEELTLTANTQPALMAVSLAAYKILEQETGKNIKDLCKAVAGHSLGQYSALCAAGSFSITAAAKLLRIRALAMQNAAPIGVGAMAAILGAEEQKINKILEKSSKVGICQIANDNSLEQKVISGNDQAVNLAIELCKENGIKAIKLKVSAPFHCQLMEPAAAKMAEALEQIELKPPLVPVIDNVLAEEVIDPLIIKECLVKQISGKVRWRETMDLIAKKYQECVEIGSGKVLTNMLKRAHPEVSCFNLSNNEDLLAILKIF